MIIIGEKLNSSIPKTLKALNGRDSAYLTGLIKRQAAAGAHYLDINTALTGADETENMLWLIRLVIENSGCGIMIDSPNPDVIRRCVDSAEDRPLIINSISIDDEYDELIEIAGRCGAGLVCLPMKGNKTPHTTAERLQNAQELTAKLRGAGIHDDAIYIDVLVEAIASNDGAALAVLNTITSVKECCPGVKTICGLSNVSFGLPRRAKLNGAFLSMAMQNGLDSAILDITSEEIRDALTASYALLGNDEYCMGYIGYCRSIMK